MLVGKVLLGNVILVRRADDVKVGYELVPLAPVPVGYNAPVLLVGVVMFVPLDGGMYVSNPTVKRPSDALPVVGTILSSSSASARLS